jgi:hypothetical protein
MMTVHVDRDHAVLTFDTLLVRDEQDAWLELLEPWPRSGR